MTPWRRSGGAPDVKLPRNSHIQGRTVVSALAATAVLAVTAPAAAAPPTISKHFGASGIPLNGTTSLSFAIGNPNPGVVTGLGFTDSLPAGLVVANPNGLSAGCDPGTVTASPGSSSVSLSGGSVPGSSVCGISVNVTGTGAGDKTNSVTI